MRLSLIAAVARNGVIGRDGGLPWRLAADLRRFKAVTTGHAVVMGRRTWEEIRRPLPGRRNIVLSRDPAFAAPGAEVVATLGEAIERASTIARMTASRVAAAPASTSGSRRFSPK